jgi:hypothetical protein
VLHVPLVVVVLSGGVLRLPGVLSAPARLALGLLLVLVGSHRGVMLSAATTLLMARRATAAAISTALAFPLGERRSGKKHRDREN